jgi:predicted nuclease of predicted toxin-antitoxin system
VKIVVDMNLSPAWVEVLRLASHEAFHWSEIGRATAPDQEIMEWAVKNGFVIFTHDLDFSTILASKNLPMPSVVQVRGQETSPSTLRDVVLLALDQLTDDLLRGALVTIDVSKTRARVLPLKPWTAT